MSVNINVNKHNVLLILCLLFLLTLAFKSSIIQYIPYAHRSIEGYEERSYNLDIGSIADQIQADYQQHMLNRQTVFDQNKDKGQTTGEDSGMPALNNNTTCQGLFQCNGQTQSTQQEATKSSVTTPPTSANAASANTNNVVPSNQQTTCNCPPQLSMDDMLSLDLWSADEKAMERAMADSQSVREAAIATVRDYQDTLRDAMMDGFAKTNAMTNASNMLETAIQNQTIAGNMPDAMMGGINAVTQPITDKVNDLSNVVQQMKAVVDRTRARCNSVRFAFGKGCKI